MASDLQDNPKFQIKVKITQHYNIGAKCRKQPYSHVLVKPNDVHGAFINFRDDIISLADVIHLTRDMLACCF